jgi:hypothetical protein
MLRQARPVAFQTKFNLLRLRPTPVLLSILFTVFPLFFLFSFAIIFTNDDNGMSNAEFEKINKEGIAIKATIVGIETQENVSINHKHPAIITYKYYVDSVNGHTIEAYDRFQTLSPQEVSRLAPGDEIEIKYLDGESIIPSLNPFSFPYWIFYVVFGMMQLVGIIFITITVRYLKKHIALYRYGNVQEAKLISVTQSTTNRSKTLHVHYQYTTPRGQTIMDGSRSNDYTLMRQTNYGDPIRIFVSPDNDQKSCIVPRLEAARNNWQIEGF